MSRTGRYTAARSLAARQDFSTARAPRWSPDSRRRVAFEPVIATGMRVVPTGPLLLLLACSGEPGSPPASSPGSDTRGRDSGAAAPTWGLEDLAPTTTCLAPARPTTDSEVVLTRVFPALDSVGGVWLAQPPDDPETFVLIEQGGRVLRFSAAGDGSDAVALDGFSAPLGTDYEEGLLGLAFHPDFASNRRVLLSYSTEEGGERASHVVAFELGEDGLGDPQEIITVAQPGRTHNGGHIAFDADGHLFFGLGDGGTLAGPSGQGQDTHTHLGALLRLDLDGAAPYAIPPDNPFADGEAGQPEIYAWGFRNPWRWSIDPETGELWLGDVGKDHYEEIDRVGLGGNYGWSIEEGPACFESEDCDDAGLIDPVHAIAHGEAKASVIVGPVYRGSAVPAITGSLLWADHYDGHLMGLRQDPETGDWVAETLVADTGLAVSAIATDAAGEAYVLDWQGTVHRVDPAPDDTGGAGDAGPAALLSETGCVDPAEPWLPAEGLVPYGVQAPLWSDGAAKERWLALPAGATLGVAGDGQLELPVGTVLVKHFELAGARVETRLLVRHEDGDWAGYSYAWDDAGTDAALLPSSAARTYGGATWTFPSRGACLSCHTRVADRALGLHLDQLDGPFTYPNGVRGDQLETWAQAGLLPAGTASARPLLDPDDDTASDEDRARSMLHANCAHCHQADGTGGGSFDLRWTLSLAETETCDVPAQRGDLGVADARLLASGAPERSVISLRMKDLGAHRMPSLGTAVVDDSGVAVLDRWIAGLEGCPE